VVFLKLSYTIGRNRDERNRIKITITELLPFGNVYGNFREWASLLTEGRDFMSKDGGLYNDFAKYAFYDGASPRSSYAHLLCVAILMSADSFLMSELHCIDKRLQLDAYVSL
jgi:hypothetical protein